MQFVCVCVYKHTCMHVLTDSTDSGNNITYSLLLTTTATFSSPSQHYLRETIFLSK